MVFSHLLSFLDVVVLSSIGTTNKHDVQLVKMPVRNRKLFMCIVLLSYDEIGLAHHVTLLCHPLLNGHKEPNYITKFLQYNMAG